MMAPLLEEEEENYIRLALLLKGVSPRAVRTYFDRQFPPTHLPSTLNKNYITLRDLKLKRVLNQAQWNLLFPRNGVPVSKTFDVTFMICLIRNLTSVTQPINGFDRLPPSVETTPGADLARIKWYRNILAHFESNKMATADFNTAWSNISDAVRRLGGQSMNQECQELKVKILDQSHQEIMLEIKQSMEEMKQLKLDILGTEHLDVTENLRKLQDSHNTLQTEHTDVTENLRKLQVSHSILQTEHTELSKDTIPSRACNIREKTLKLSSSVLPEDQYGIDMIFEKEKRLQLNISGSTRPADQYDMIFGKADFIRKTKDDVEMNVCGVKSKPTAFKDDVEMNGYNGAKMDDKFYQLQIVCDNFVVDCIVDNRLDRKCRESVFEFQECIEEMIQWSETLLWFNKKVEEKFLSIVETKNSCLCKYLLDHTSNKTIETHILVNALYSSIKNNDVDTAKFIGWQIARNFLKSLNVPVYDIWLATLCGCSRLIKKPCLWFCSSNVTIIIMVPHLNKEVVNNFFGIPIKQIVYHCETFKEAQAISEESARMLERDLNIQCHVPGPLAEKLFNSHRRLSLISPSEIKSIHFKDYLAMSMFLKCSCIQLFCHVKGAIPIGEEHFPSELQGIPTDVIEGFPRFSSNNLKIGDCVTNLKMEGTLGGFCRSYGREAFLTCAHVMIDWDTLLSPGNKYHMQPEFVYNNNKILNGPSPCGKVVNHKFTHHNPRKTSVDVALIEIADGVSVSDYDYVNTRGKGPLNYAQLGLKSRYLHDSYIRSLHGLSGQNVRVVCAGAVSGFNSVSSSISEKSEHVLEREGLQSASTNLETRTCNYLDEQAQVSTPVHMRAHVPAIIHESRKEEVYSRRTLRFYNQIAVNNIPFQQGDSGACIYITNGYTETGCLGMAIADLPGGGCIVTPMAKLLEKLGLI